MKTEITTSGCLCVQSEANIQREKEIKEQPIKQLIGEILSSVNVSREKDTIVFVTNTGIAFEMYHSQDCCESVIIEDIEGDLNDLVGSPITQAEESTSTELFNGKPENPDSFTWTFYKLATVKGYVTIRWLGESNGYYSERVDFKKLK